MNRKQIIAQILNDSKPKFDISLLTDDQLKKLKEINNRDDIHYISVEKAIQQYAEVIQPPEGNNKPNK